MRAIYSSLRLHRVSIIARRGVRFLSQMALKSRISEFRITGIPIIRGIRRTSIKRKFAARKSAGDSDRARLALYSRAKNHGRNSAICDNAAPEHSHIQRDDTDLVYVRAKNRSRENRRKCAPKLIRTSIRVIYTRMRARRVCARSNLF